MAGTTVRNFTPGGTVSLSVTTGSSTAAALATAPAQRKDVRLVNNGGNICFFKFGDSTVAATTADTPLRAGADMLVHAADATHIAAISATGATTLYATTGFGN